ncbi:MAG: alpha/beta hydrolase [Acidobacteria bacterium]|nr:alpha/beta hydrolase [Acidobacteriota bacterium]
MPLREIQGPAGRLEALLDEPMASGDIGADGRLASGHADGVRAAVVFAHPHTEYGGTMHTKAVYQAAKALSRVGCAVLRLNFRGAGASAGRFSNGPGEMDDFRAALAFMRQRYPDAKLWAGGMSFGSWIALTVGAADPGISTLVGIAPPLSRYDFESVARSTTPKFFIQGERDELCPLKDMREFYARAAEPKELVVIDGADHLFDGKVNEVADAIEDLLEDWNE